MGSQYEGDETVFPIDFTIPDDLDDDAAVTFNVALEALGDRTKFNKKKFDDYLALKSPRLRMIEFLASGTYVPDIDSRIVAAFAGGCGGGGGGGAGINGSLTVNTWMCGGGGGGGSIWTVVPVPIIAGTTYNIDIGAGGAAQAAQGGTGGDGGDSVLRIGATAIAAWGGAQGGRGAIGLPSPSLWQTFALSGASRANMPSLFFGDPTKGCRFDASDAMWLISALQMRLAIGQGGYGAGGSANLASAGAPNSYGNFAGGAGGVQGADAGTHRGGGGGGGGAAGPFGDGGAGGDGGPGDTSGSGGGSGADNSGAGGGGSGSGGYGNFGRGPSGAGGSGRVRLMVVEESP